MSMRNYAVDDYGIIIEREIAINISKKVNPEFSVEDGNSPEYEVYDNGIGEYISEFTGECFKVSKDGSVDNWSSVYNFDSDTILYLSVPKWGTLFKAAYTDMEELVADMKEKYSEWLPNDFDYAANIVKITGTYYG